MVMVNEPWFAVCTGVGPGVEFRALCGTGKAPPHRNCEDHYLSEKEPDQNCDNKTGRTLLIYNYSVCRDLIVTRGYLTQKRPQTKGTHQHNAGPHKLSLSL